jgi:epoxyqueuosine reductase QueG
MEVKERARELGADLCGITSAERLGNAPKGFRPTDIYPACKSVVVFAKRLPPALFESTSPSPYTLVGEGERGRVLDTLAVELCNWLYDKGVNAFPIPSDAPYDHWEAERKHGQGILSLKHAAEQAGLGRIGRNSLLVNEKYGNMINLGAVVTDTWFEPDKIVPNAYCADGCRICIDSCPSRALDGVTTDQKRCRDHSATTNARGHHIVGCSICRKVCPNAKVVRSKDTTSKTRMD